MQTCQRAAPSVTACAVPPSSGRKALVFRAIQTCLSLWERCRAATERAGFLFEGAGLPPCGKTEGVLSNWQDTHEICPDADLFACCSFRHGLRRATFLREEGFGFPRSPNLSLPLGEMSRSDREGRLPLRGSWICRRQRLREFCQSGKIRMRFALIQTCPCAAPSVTACAVPPSSGRKALVFRAVQLVSPFGRDVAQRQRGLAPSSRELDLPQAKTEGVLQIGKIRIRFDLIRTC